MAAIVCILCVFTLVYLCIWVLRSRMETSSSELRILPGFADRRSLTAAAAAACSTPLSVSQTTFCVKCFGYRLFAISICFPDNFLCLVYLCVCVFAGVF